MPRDGFPILNLLSLGPALYYAEWDSYFLMRVWRAALPLPCLCVRSSFKGSEQSGPVVYGGENDTVRMYADTVEYARLCVGGTPR